MMRYILLLLVGAAAPMLAQEPLLSGTINHYEPVLAIDTCGYDVVVASADSLAPLDRVMIIQMTGAIVDSTQTPAFGSILDWGGAGRYEIGTVRAIDGNRVILNERLLRAYDPAQTQLVRVPRYPSARIVGTITARPFDGRIGGVIALEVLGTLTMDAPIDATASGFRGGHIIMTAVGLTCDVQSYFVSDGMGTGGGKGRGIAVLFDTMYTAARGAIANGGGGGNDHNSGGGGGGNGGTGGTGGLQWSGCESLPTGGIGGRAISRSAATDLLFMGGGGGSGHANNSTGTPGGHGGGIVVLRATRIDARGNAIIADGESPQNTAGNDAAGGGGGGGTIVLDADTVVSSLRLQARGGRGAYVSGDLGCHGPGGGGGAGAVRFSSREPLRNVAIDLAGGAPGMMLSPTLPCYNTSYGAQPGDSGDVRVDVPVIEGHAYPTIFISANDAEPGDTVAVAVRLRHLPEFAFRPLREVGLALANDARLLMPMNQVAIGAAAVSGDTVFTPIESRFEAGTDTIAVVPMIAMLGHSSTATIEIVDAAFAPQYIRTCPAVGDVINGTVTIELCEEGGERVVRTGSAAALKSITPNPSSMSATLRYSLAEDGSTRIVVRDMRGDIVRVVVDGTARSGEHSVSINVASLPSGTYSVELVTPTERSTRSLRIVR